VIAYSRIRPGPLYRSEAFHSGLRSCGFAVSIDEPRSPKREDVLLIWNRYQWQDLKAATVFERAGATVLVAENAYIWNGGLSPHHMKDRPSYALARGWHNDASVVRMTDEDRWSPLDVKIAPWRTSGQHILVCPNRPFGAPGRVMPENWTREVVARLRPITKREIRVRQHPGNNAPAKPLSEDLAGAWACVIWGSSAGVHSIVAGVPVIQLAPNWICTRAAGRNLDTIETPEMNDQNRLDALRIMSHSQFSLDEIACGFAFKQVLS
jgi:hypothetical protein